MKTAIDGHFVPEFPSWTLKSEFHDSQIPQDIILICFFLSATQKYEKHVLICELYKMVYVASCRPVGDT